MQSRFLAACGSRRELLPDGPPEVAVAGRSNCGKSSLINAVCGRRKLARTSSTPGRTRQIVMFELRAPGAPPLRLVDLPGYGFARVSRSLHTQWGELISGYLDRRRSLALLMLLMDARRDVADEERDLVTWMAGRGVPVQVVLTKADKLNKSQRFAAASRVARDLALAVPPTVTSVRDPASIETVRRGLVALVTQLERG